MASSNERRNKAIMDQFIKELKQLPEEFDKVAEKVLNETLDVAEIKVKDLTPVVTGDARAKWQTKHAYKVKNEFRARLYNNSAYIGYLNNGHRMNPHFVPGYWSGKKFEYDPNAKEGVIMGAKSKYVEGEFMLEKASGNAEKYLVKATERELEKIKRKYEGNGR